MVNFSVFNELSLPLDAYSAKDKFGILFELLEKLRDKRLNQIRMSEDFKNYNILEGITFSHFMGTQERDFKTRLRSFVNNSVVKINSPIIHASEQEQRDIMSDCEYYYNSQSNDGGLACADIWNTISVSFNTDSQWEKHAIILRKQKLTDNGRINETEINIKHASSISHLTHHDEFFQDLEGEIRREITQQNFWQHRNETFPNTIVFCPEVEAQIKKLDKKIFQQAIGILRDIETKQKCPTDFSCSRESETVRHNADMKNERMFTVNGNKVFFEHHLKSLSNVHRIYFLQENNKIHVGYIGKHLATALYG